MGRAAQLADKFTTRDVKPLGLSMDTAEEHVKWIEDMNDTQNANLEFPIITTDKVRNGCGTSIRFS